MAGLIYYNNGNSWRYENEGTTQGLKVSGTTVTGLASTKSKTGTAFWQTNRVSTFPIPATKELWVKFDLYYGGAQWRVYDRLNGNDTGFGLIDNTTTLVSYINGPLKLVPQPENTITKNQLHTFLLHMVSDATNGIVEVWADGIKYYTADYVDEKLIYKGNVENGADFENLYLQSQNANCLFSNVIISNERIGLGENVINHGLTSVLDFDVVREIDYSSIPVTVDFDLLRDTREIWVYKNYGTAALLVPETDAITVTDLPLEKSRTGSAFQKPRTSYPKAALNKIFDMPETDEVWIKFDVYTSKDDTDDTNTSNYIHSFAVGDVSYTMGNGISSYAFDGRDHSVIHAERRWSSDAVGKNYTTKKIDSNLTTFLIHMKSDTTNGVVEFWIDGEYGGNLRGNVNDGESFSGVSIELYRGICLFSNLIISNGRIEFNEYAINDFVSVEFFFDTVREIVNNKNVLDIDFDLERNVTTSISSYFDIARDIMGIFRYENYGGDADLLPTNAEVITDTDYEYTRTGAAFINATDNIPTIPLTDEVWIRCDCYSPQSEWPYFVIGEFKGETPVGIVYQDGVLSVHNQDGSTPPALFEKYIGYGLKTFWLHLKASTDNTDGLIEVYVDGELFYRFTGAIPQNHNSDFDSICLFNQDFVYISNAIISNAPVEFNSIVVSLNLDTLRDVTNASERIVQLDFDTLRLVGNVLELNFDTARKVINPPLTWRYENYGTADLLLPESSKRTDPSLPSTQSRTGSAFTVWTSKKSFDIPATNEIWIKFDVYIIPESGNYEGEFSVHNSISQDLWCGIDYESWAHREEGKIEFYSYVDSYVINDSEYTDKRLNSLQTWLIHMKSGTTNGLMEVWVNGEHIGNRTGNVNDGNAFDNVYFYTLYDVWFSNVIVSNTEIGLNENVKYIFEPTPFEFYFDLSRNVRENFRYENYGITELLSPEANAEEVKTTKDKSKYYIGFYNMANSLPFVDIPATDEIWIKFDVSFYTDKSPLVMIDWDVGNDSKYYYKTIQISRPFADTSWGEAVAIRYQAVYYGRQREGTSKSRYIYPNEIKSLETVLVHIKVDENQGIVECWFAGNKQIQYIGDTSAGVDGSTIRNVSIMSRRRESNTVENVIFSNIIISNTEIGLSDNCKLAVSSSYDTERYLTYMWNGDTWRYENYGVAFLLSVAGTTVELTKSQSKYYSGFQATASRQNYFGIPNTKEIWIKFDLYFDARYQTLFVGSLDDGKTSQIRLNCCGTSSDYHRIIFALDNSVANNQTNQLYSQTFYRVLVHMKSDATNGKIELFVSDGYNLSYTGNVNNGNNFENVYIQASHYNNITTYPYVSNVIISNSEVGIDENCKMPLIESCNVVRSIANAFAFDFDTLRNIALSQTFNFDMLRQIQRGIINTDNDIWRVLVKSLEIDYDTVRTMPHSVMLSTIEQAGEITPGSGVPTTENDTGGLQSIEISIAEQELTDRVSFTAAFPVKVLDQIKGQYLDYEYNMRVENTNHQGILYTCNCCSDIDEILYKQLDYHIPATEVIYIDASSNEISHLNPKEESVPIARASKHIIKIAETLGKQPVMQFDDFKSTVDIEVGGVTYNDLIRDIFGWTGRLPHKKINCYLRGDRLYVVQRGHEANVIDLTATDHTVPVVNEELIRTTWGSSIWSKNEVKSTFIGGQWFHTEYHPKETSQNNNKYEYDNDGLITYTRKEGKEQGSFTETHYYYDTLENGKKILTKEETEIWEGNSVVDRQTVWHEYLDQGQTHVMAENEDGDYLGSVVGQSKGDDRPRKSPFDSQDYWTAVYKPGKQQRTLYGLSLIDTSFPVYGDDKLEEITQAIIQLNRKIQETITFDVYNYNHIIDFNDRILFNGNIYYLESNTAVKTPRIVNKQTVSFVRWLL